MKVTIDVTLDHKGNPRGSGKAAATIIFIDRKGKRYERKAAAAVENDTKNALALKITTAALKILIKPCDVEIHLDNEYIKNCIKNGWLDQCLHKSLGLKQENNISVDAAKLIKERDLYKDLYKRLSNEILGK